MTGLRGPGAGGRWSPGWRYAGCSMCPPPGLLRLFTLAPSAEACWCWCWGRACVQGWTMLAVSDIIPPPPGYPITEDGGCYRSLSAQTICRLTCQSHTQHTALQGDYVEDKCTIRSIVCEASCHPVTQSFGHLIIQSFGLSVT